MKYDKSYFHNLNIPINNWRMFNAAELLYKQLPTTEYRPRVSFCAENDIVCSEWQDMTVCHVRSGTLLFNLLFTADAEDNVWNELRQQTNDARR